MLPRWTNEALTPYCLPRTSKTLNSCTDLLTSITFLPTAMLPTRQQSNKLGICLSCSESSCSPLEAYTNVDLTLHTLTHLLATAHLIVAFMQRRRRSMPSQLYFDLTLTLATLSPTEVIKDESCTGYLLFLFSHCILFKDEACLSAKTKAHLWVVVSRWESMPPARHCRIQSRIQQACTAMGAHIYLTAKWSLRLLLEYWPTMLDPAGKGKAQKAQDRWT